MSTLIAWSGRRFRVRAFCQEEPSNEGLADLRQLQLMMSPGQESPARVALRLVFLSHLVHP